MRVCVCMCECLWVCVAICVRVSMFISIKYIYNDIIIHTSKALTLYKIFVFIISNMYVSVYVYVSQLQDDELSHAPGWLHIQLSQFLKL